MYRNHVRFNLFFALPVLLGTIYYCFHPSLNLLITFAGVFIYSTLFMNPDLDIANRVKLFSFRGLMTLPFRSYAKCFSHRGLSHNVILGSLTRIIWLIFWGIAIFFLIYKTLPNTTTLYAYYQQYRPFVFYTLSAICLADWCHLLLDRKMLKT